MGAGGISVNSYYTDFNIHWTVGLLLYIVPNDMVSIGVRSLVQILYRSLQCAFQWWKCYFLVCEEDKFPESYKKNCECLLVQLEKCNLKIS